MGRLFVITLEGSIYSCKHCKTHLALADHIISKELMKVDSSVSKSSDTGHLQGNAKSSTWRKKGRHGKAYLFDKVVNITVGEKEERMMITGMHTVVDIFCVGCGSIVGWKYESAHEKSQKYKEGKFILERFKILGPDGSVYVISQEVQHSGSDADDI